MSNLCMYIIQILLCAVVYSWSEIKHLISIQYNFFNKNEKYEKFFILMFKTFRSYYPIIFKRTNDREEKIKV